MNVSVLGGSGLIGNAIVRCLHERGHQVTAVGRRAQAPRNLAHLDTRYLGADTATPEGIDGAVAGQDAVVDAAAPYPLYLFDSAQGTRRQCEQRAAMRTERLVNAARRAGASLIYIGTQVSAPPPGPGGWMDLPLRMARAAHPYFAVKRLIDEKIAQAQASGLAAVSIQPSACIGPWDIKPVDQCWVPALLNGQLRVSVDHPVNVVDTRDVAIAVADTLEAQRYGPPVSVSGNETSVRELFATFCMAAGVPAPRLAVPAPLGVLPGLWSETVLATMGVRSPLPGLIPLLICEQGRVKVRNQGPPPRPLQTTVNDTIDWYQRLGYCRVSG